MPPVLVNRPGRACRKQPNHSLSHLGYNLLTSRLHLNSRIVLFAMSAFLIPPFEAEERKGRYGT